MGLFWKIFKGKQASSFGSDVKKESTGADEYARHLRAERKEKTRPIVEYVDATGKFYSYNGREFDFSNIPAEKGQEVFLLGGANADKVMNDLYELNKFSEEAEKNADVPSFRVPLDDVLLSPAWIEKGYDMRWVVSRISPLPLTKTGGYPKYPFMVYIETKSGNYAARIKYTQNDVIGEAEIKVNSKGCFYTMTIRDGKIIRIIRTVGLENFPVYSKK